MKIKDTHFFLMLVLLLAACDNQPPPVTPTRNDTAFSVSIVATTPERAASLCADLGVNKDMPDHVERGCAVFHLEKEHCDVIVPVPQHVDDDRTTILGHEILHCMSGRYHR